MTAPMHLMRTATRPNPACMCRHRARSPPHGRACAVIMARHAEGFGLPILEAQHYGTPAIVSDIPVFKEIGGNSVSYFSVGNSKALSKILMDWTPPARHKVSTSTFRTISWAESAKNFRDFIFGAKTY